jgi:anti-sigma regulatory factor (Ser/Thr protein kinase)
MSQATITMPAELRPLKLDWVLNQLWGIHEDANKSSVVLDFGRVTKAFPNTMLPIIGMVAFMRSEGLTCLFLPPTDRGAKQLFERTNWSHLLDPTSFSSSVLAHNRNLAARAFVDSGQQREVVQQIVDRVLESKSFSPSTLNALSWTLSELADNVLTHAESPVGGLVQLEVMKERIAFCIVDIGRGILSSLRPKYANLRTAAEAIAHAVRAGVTRDDAIGQGNGLYGSLRLAIEFQGQFAIQSTNGSARWDGRDFVSSDDAVPFPGTIVDLQMADVASVNVGAVITGDPNTQYQPMSVIEERFLGDDLTTLTIKMSEDLEGWGSRDAGRKARIKLTNVIANAPGVVPVVVDWSGIGVIASSYADEFIGKAFAELGPMRFMQRVRMTGMAPFVSQLVDRAIQQRVAQSVRYGGSV